MARLRTHLAALAFGMSLALGGGPASALERFVLRLPFLETEIAINFADGESVEQLIDSGQSGSAGSGIGQWWQVVAAVASGVPYAIAPGEQGRAVGSPLGVGAGCRPLQSS